MGQFFEQNLFCIYKNALKHTPCTQRELTCFLEHCQIRLCFCSGAEFLHHRHISHVFQSGFLAPSKIRLHEVIFRHPLRFPNVIIPAKCMTQFWFQQFCCPAGLTEATRTNTYTVLWFHWTVMRFPLPISQCQMERE